MEQKERKIYLSELFKYIRKNIVKVIAGSIVFAIAFVGFLYVSDMRKYNGSIESGKNIIEAEELTYDEIKIVDNLIMMQDRADFYQNYLEKSYLMNMDVYNVNKVVLQYYVDSEYTFDLSSDNELDYTTSLLEMYNIYMNSSEFRTNIMNDLDEEYIKELFAISTNYDAKTLNISVYVPENANSETIKERLMTLIKEKENEIQAYGKHKLITLSEDIIQEYDSGLESKLYSIRKTISDTRSQVIVLKADLTENQQNYLQNYYDIKKQETIEKPNLKVVNIVLGIVLGSVIMCAYYMFASILSGRLQCADDIRVMFGVKVLGEYTGTNMDEYLATKIKCTCEKNNINQLLIIGSACNEAKGIENVIDLIKNSNIDVVHANSIIDDSSSYKKMCEINNVILLEKKHVSKYNDIAEELQIIIDNKVNIIGTIVVQ